MRCRALLLGVLALTVCATQVRAHPLAPALLELRERSGAVTEVLWKTPLLKPTGAPIVPLLPASCAALAPPVVIEESGSLSARWSVRCAGSWIGQTLSIRGLEETRMSALVRIEEQRPRGIAGIRHMERAAGELPDKPAVDGAGTCRSRLSRRPQRRIGIEQVAQLRGRECRVER